MATYNWTYKGKTATLAKADNGWTLTGEGISTPTLCSTPSAAARFFAQKHGSPEASFNGWAVFGIPDSERTHAPRGNKRAPAPAPVEKSTLDKLRDAIDRKAALVKLMEECEQEITLLRDAAKAEAKAEMAKIEEQEKATAARKAALATMIDEKKEEGPKAS